MKPDLPVAKGPPRQGGFTLIELIVVLVILGILAAFAIPRFAGVNRDARESAMKGLAGSLRSSSALVHGLALARGATGATGSVTLEGTAVTLVYGYPTADDAGIKATVLNFDGFTALTGGDLPAGAGVAYTTSTKPANVASCYVAYKAATATTPAEVSVPASLDCS